MSVDRSWQLGNPGSIVYSAYDAVRKRLNRYLVGYLMKQIDSRPASIVLEAGSGTGYASSIIAAHSGVRLGIALDYDIDALREARKRDSRLPVVVADVRALPFRAECIDLVWNSSTLEHLPDRQVAVAEIRRVARSDGYIFIGVPFLYGPLGFQRWIAATSAGIWIGTVFDRASLQRLIRGSGLEPIDSLVYFFRFFVGVLARKSAANQGETQLG